MVKRIRGDFYGQAITSLWPSIAVGIPAAGESPWNHGEVHFHATEDEEPQIIRAPNPSPLGYFGTRIALTETWMAVAESRRGFERVRLFYRNDAASPWQWTQAIAGPAVSSLALQDSLLVIAYQFESNAPGPEVFPVYQEGAQEWERVFSERRSGLANSIDDYSTFLSHVALKDDTLLLGVAGDPGDNQAQGVAFLYQKANESTRWNQIAAIKQVEPKSGFGSCVAINSRWIAIGAPRTKRSDIQSGAVYVYDRTLPLSANASPTFVLETPSVTGGHFGRTVALNGDRILIGAPSQHWELSTSGAAYLFDLGAQDGPALGRMIEPSIPGTRGFGNALAYSQERLLIGSEHVPLPLNDLTAQLTLLNEANDKDLDRLPDSWEEMHFTNREALPSGDPDKDHQTNLDEFLAGTDPHVATSPIEIQSIVRRGTEIDLSWQALPNVVYTVLGSNDLTVPRWDLIKSVKSESNVVTHTLPIEENQRFFRLLIC